DINGNRVEGTALRVAQCLNKVFANYPSKKAILIFNDMESVRVDCLKSEIEKLQLNHIEVYYKKQDCNAFLRELDLDSYKNKYHTLLLYDPYNASIDWGAITPYLNRWGEVIINHMSSDTIRGISQAKKTGAAARYEETYQSSVESLLNASRDDLDKIVVSIIQNNVHKSSYYVSPFAFYNRTNGKLYSLIHCSASVEGIKLYKKVAWQTFGNKSSLKNTHGLENQLTLDLDGNGVSDVQTDEQCYFIHDIAKYIYDKYCARGEVGLNEIYDDLDAHPIFPSDGYKDDIKRELKQFFGVKFPKGGKVIFSDIQGAVR
ncbi:MAG: three-Cys-motif partner protein TcmP, partial [Agathobacter sp.]|nr:three-Cys-motif partner protein TcmP [Agathobacter sp.]